MATPNPAPRSSPPKFTSTSSTLSPIRAGHVDSSLCCCSGFFQTEDLKNIPAPDLQNAVHPVFSRSLFAPTVDYDAILPCLKAASKVLDVMVQFYHTIFFGNVQQLSGSGQNGGARWVISDSNPDPMRPLTRARRAATEKALKALGQAGQFELLRITDMSDGLTTKRPREPASVHDPLFEGSCYTVSLGQYAIRVLIAERAGTIDAVKAAVMRHQLMNTLLHELVHGAIMARYPFATIDEVYIDNGVMAEEGYHFEALAFGGELGLLSVKGENLAGAAPYTIDGRGSDLSAALTMFDQPSGVTIRDYTARGWSIGARGSIPSIRVHWAVPFSYALQFFSTEWWKDVTRIRDPAALLAPKLRGYRFIDDDVNDPEGRWYDKPTEVADKTSGVPAKYMVTDTGLIVPKKKSPKASPKPSPGATPKPSPKSSPGRAPGPALGPSRPRVGRRGALAG